MQNQIQVIVKETVNQTLKALGVPISETITFAAIKKANGLDFALKAWESPLISWMQKGKGGKTSPYYCMKSDYETFLKAQ